MSLFLFQSGFPTLLHPATEAATVSDREPGAVTRQTVDKGYMVIPQWDWPSPNFGIQYIFLICSSSFWKLCLRSTFRFCLRTCPQNIGLLFVLAAVCLCIPLINPPRLQLNLSVTCRGMDLSAPPEMPDEVLRMFLVVRKTTLHHGHELVFV